MTDAAALIADPAAALATLGEQARVRLGAAADTSPEMLRTLAADASVVVRAAVAMNVAAPMQADRMLAADRDERVRTLLARKLASLIPGVPMAQRSALAEHVLATLSELVADETIRVRSAIADIVKEMPQAPRELVLRLAYDSSVPVSEPVVRLSPLLSTEDLLTLLADAPATGTATAVARRPGLQEAVSDAIAASADTAAITELLANRSAAIREATLDALIARAAQHGEWHDPLVHRPTLSARAARALSEIVATQLLGALASRGDLDPEVTRDLQRRLQQRQAEAPAAEPTADVALARAEALQAQGKLDEATLLAAAQRAETRQATALLAVAAQVPVSVVERACTLRSAKGLVSLVWKAGFSVRCAGPLQVLLARLGPAQVLRANDSGGFPLTLDEMRWQLDFLQHIGR